MRVLIWSLRIALFLFLFVLAALNSRTVTLRFLFDASWQLPLSFVILIFFTAGAAFGLAVAGASLVRSRRDSIRARREADALRAKQGG
ncbi:MAG: hypothetical protein OHK0026_11350 [Rhodocyclaceae bacterium]